MITYKMSKRMYNFIKFPKRRKDKPLSKKEIIKYVNENFGLLRKVTDITII